MESLEGIMNHIVHKRNGDAPRCYHDHAYERLRNPDAVCTRPAADKNDQRPEGDPKKFKVGLLGDYLRNGYDQRMTTPKDMRENPIDY